MEDSWTGRWGGNPLYHALTFILTHHPRDPIVMEGGTTFQFVRGEIHAAMERARDSADDRDVKIGDGVSMVRQYLQAGLISEAYFAFCPVLLGRDEAMFEGLDLPELGYRMIETVPTGSPRTSSSAARRPACHQLQASGDLRQRRECRLHGKRRIRRL
ncbi:hypothetical protein FHG71_21185 [Rubellimicrobium roseum]|uniref:Bacterial bifunctional deaminase-reductase C-terminal domain-containing protein n=1 Tax=Rubellimicrobium roseum TaxID=687525 RepID=A0A5C4NAX5_9RHOB|nr:hypothetical protein FHG71_21185 [Rubellimicrobium roseum]